MSAAVDVAIVGGGPAGLATAIEARLAGLSAAVLDRGRPPLDKACGEGLMPDAVARLAAMGVPLAGRPFRGIRYLDGGTVAQGTFPGPPGLGVRRTALHAALAARARELGADLRWGTAATGLAPEGVETAAGLLPARFVVGADGLNSRVRRGAGLESTEPAKASRHARRFGVRRHYAMAPWSDFVEVTWGREAEAYVTPVAGDEVGVAILWSGPARGFDDLLPRFPELAARLSGVPAASRDRGAGP
ncbi:MAG TPA: FAD-dependent monooxygenase, partial [Solirubrobacterales bacterium]|nr:FAD-dependent monooxygenase [Solirubrobacterales bacterium]